jgi:hypothetical protein
MPVGGLARAPWKDEPAQLGGGTGLIDPVSGRRRVFRPHRPPVIDASGEHALALPCRRSILDGWIDVTTGKRRCPSGALARLNKPALVAPFLPAYMHRAHPHRSAFRLLDMQSTPRCTTSSTSVLRRAVNSRGYRRAAAARSKSIAAGSSRNAIVRINQHKTSSSRSHQRRQILTGPRSASATLRLPSMDRGADKRRARAWCPRVPLQSSRRRRLHIDRITEPILSERELARRAPPLVIWRIFIKRLRDEDGRWIDSRVIDENGIELAADDLVARAAAESRA